MQLQSFIVMLKMSSMLSSGESRASAKLGRSQVLPSILLVILAVASNPNSLLALCNAAVVEVPRSCRPVPHGQGKGDLDLNIVVELASQTLEIQLILPILKGSQ